MGTEADSQRARRYLQLIEELGVELGKGRGWMAAVAERLGVHRSTLLRVYNGERGVTSTLIERAIRKLDLDPDYFAAREGPYRRWVRGPLDAPIPRERDIIFAGWERAGEIAAECRKLVFAGAGDTGESAGGPSIDRGSIRRPPAPVFGS